MVYTYSMYLNFKKLLFLLFCFVTMQPLAKSYAMERENKIKLFAKKGTLSSLYAQQAKNNDTNDRSSSSMPIVSQALMTPYELLVPQQNDPASCAFHALKNAFAVFKDIEQCKKLLCDSERREITSSLFSVYAEKIVKLRQKIALQEYIQKEIESLHDKKNYSDTVYSNAIVNCALDLSEKACENDFNTYDIVMYPYATIIDFVYKKIPSEKQMSYKKENVKKALPQGSLMVTRDVIGKALYAKYAKPILAKSAIELTQEENKLLLNALVNLGYNKLADTLTDRKSQDEDLKKSLAAIQVKMEKEDNLEPLLAEQNRVKEEWLQKVAQEHNILFPNNSQLLNQFYDNPYLFADMQGLWLEGAELRALINENDVLKNNSTVIDNADLLEYEDIINLSDIQKAWKTKEKFAHAFFINTARESNNSERGHWFVVVLNKVSDTQKECIVLNSLKSSNAEKQAVTTLKARFES